MKITITAIFIALLIIIGSSFIVHAAGSGGGGSVAVSSESNCTQDIYSCTDWSDCTQNGTQIRTCTLVSTCANADNTAPLDTVPCSYVSDLAKTLKCTNLSSMIQRVECRLGLNAGDLSNELNIAYLPEECRALNDAQSKDDCIRLYSDGQKCWTVSGNDRTSCLQELLNVSNLDDRLRQCSSDSGCLASLRRNVYAYVKFRIYDLEERAEYMMDKGLITKSQTADIISKLENDKLTFNNADSNDGRKKALIEAKNDWKDFIAGLEAQ